MHEEARLFPTSLEKRKEQLSTSLQGTWAWTDGRKCRQRHLKSAQLFMASLTESAVLQGWSTRAEGGNEPKTVLCAVTDMRRQWLSQCILLSTTVSNPFKIRRMAEKATGWFLFVKFIAVTIPPDKSAQIASLLEEQSVSPFAETEADSHVLGNIQ